jgi:hypothetical protein
MASNVSCGGYGLVCCMPVDASVEDAGDAGAADGGPSVGWCNLVPCAGGCTCEPPGDDAGGGVCVCPHAGNDADAASDAGGDAEVDGAAEAGSDGATVGDASEEDSGRDAGDAGDTSEACGVIRCALECTCSDLFTSACECPW